MKRKHYIFIIALYSAPMIIVVSWIFFHTLFPEKKCVVAQLKSVGYCMKIAEVGDNTLHIEMYKSRKGHDIDIIARDAFWKVISLVFVEKKRYGLHQSQLKHTRLTVHRKRETECRSYKRTKSKQPCHRKTSEKVCSYSFL